MASPFRCAEFRTGCRRGRSGVVLPVARRLDAVGALLVGVFIVRVSWQLAKPALEELVDASMDGKAAAVAAVARVVPGVASVHKVRARRYGRAYQADLHVQVDAGLTIEAGHAIAHAVKEAVIQAGIDVDDVVVHVEPDSTSETCLRCTNQQKENAK